MSIRINIPITKCQSGSTIAGDVSLCGDKDIGVQIISISLVGRCKTKVIRSNGNSSTTYRGRAPLIHQRQQLFKGPHTLHPGHSWPFAFTLPARVAAHQSDFCDRNRGLFDVDPEQSLPPTFVSANNSFGWSAECFVRYELEAQLIGHSNNIFSSGDSQATRLLDFSVTRNVENPVPRIVPANWNICCASIHLEPGREDERLSFKEKLKSMRTSKLPMAKFSIQMMLPNVAIIGRAVPLAITLDHDIEGSSAPALPPVFLRKCFVELCAITTIQCVRNNFLKEGNEIRDWEETSKIASCDFSSDMDKAPAVTEHMDLGKVMRIAVPRFTRPTFRTFNIRRIYRLSVTLQAECAQKTFKREFSTRQFDVLPAEYVPSIDENSVATNSNAIQEFEAAPMYEEKPPPRYEDAKQGA